MTSGFDGTQDNLNATAIANASLPREFTEADVSSDFTLDGKTFLIFVGTGGDVVAVGENDTTAVTFKNVADGSWLQGRFKEIKSTTTADDIVVGR
jgi:hypothetical protein